MRLAIAVIVVVAFTVAGFLWWMGSEQSSPDDDTPFVLNAPPPTAAPEAPVTRVGDTLLARPSPPPPAPPAVGPTPPAASGEPRSSIRTSMVLSAGAKGEFMKSCGAQADLMAAVPLTRKDLASYDFRGLADAVPMFRGFEAKAMCEAVKQGTIAPCDALTGMPNREAAERCRSEFLLYGVYLRHRIVKGKSPADVKRELRNHRVGLPLQRLVDAYIEFASEAEPDCSRPALKRHGESDKICEAFKANDPDHCDKLETPGNRELCRAFMELPVLLRAGNTGPWRHPVTHTLAHDAPALLLQDDFDCNRALRYAVAATCDAIVAVQTE